MSGQQQPQQRLATEREVADWMALTPRQLADLRRAGQGPRHIALTAKAIRYAWADVYAYAHRRRELIGG
ncbi:DNA-binding protein [Curtobacterium sp. VKM Ac-2861]|uniref:helix-turn-helix transcriptional regulator n=1 Tax=Curtobacterium sp. VKM Ac-2861 TaxID=2739016 RepID=UPI001566C79D|nr:DNA-binding protein [Curtobacterium sp. VKM Ac-2861]